MCRRIVGTILALFVLAVIGTLYLASRPSATHVNVLASKVDAARAQERVREALKSPDPVDSPTAPPPDQLENRAAPVHPDQQYAVRLSQDDINTLLATNPAVTSRLQRAKVDSATVEFAEPNKLVLIAQMQLGGSERAVQVSGTLSADDSGDVAFHSDSAQVGSLPLPVSSNASLDERAAQLLALAMPKLPISVRTVSISGQTMTLTGPRRAG